jgi:hypothetical protein
VTTTPTVKVSDADGNGVSGTMVTFTVAAGGGVLGTTAQATSASGMAGTTWTLGRFGTNTITATAAGVNGNITFTANAIAPTLTQLGAGYTGYLSGWLNGNNPPPEEYRYGFGFYSSVHTLNAAQVLAQLGWGTWLYPENRSFGQPLCPTGTLARDNWPEWGPTWDGVYQTVEGGMGQWLGSRFPSPTPKFRLNATPDCYNTQISSSAWQFGGTLLPAGKIGLAQLSNRILVPPDGFTFVSTASSQSFVGHAWLALPLTPAYTSPAGVPTGDQSWTLFMRTSNFNGAIAFYTPETWSAVHTNDRTAVGRGHDTRPGWAGSAAIEFGTIPVFENTDSTGVRYRRIPALTFPANANGEAIIQQDFRYYSRQAIWNGVANWIDNGVPAAQLNTTATTEANITTTNFGVRMIPGDEAIELSNWFTGGTILTSTGRTALGIKWIGTTQRGLLPEYYRRTGSSWRPVPVAEVPRETWLIDQSFRTAPTSSFPAVDQSASSPWTSARWRAGPFTTSLNDGSVVEYVWYKFIEQPAIARLGLSDQALQKLQTFVESFHERNGLIGIGIAPPTSGAIATFDSGLFVTPPAGLEKGYVPVVIRQR